MNPAFLVLAAPALGLLLLMAVPSWRVGIWINCAASTATFAAALALPWLAGQGVDAGGPGLLLDALSIYLAILTAFVGLAASWYGIFHDRAMADRSGWDARRLRFYHVLFQVLLGTALLALLSDDPAVTWAAIAAASIAAMLATALHRTVPAVEAARRFFLIGGVGLVLALFGTLLLYRAMPPSLAASLRWSILPTAAPRCDGAMLTLAFALLLIGYGTLAALAPLHGWLEDLMAEGSTPIIVMLTGSLLTVASGVLLRLRDAMAANHAAGGGAIAPGGLLMTLGLVSVLFAGFTLWRRRDAKRFFALAAVGQAGMAIFAFGIGSPVARFAGLLHLTLFTLSTAAIAICVDAAARRRGGRRFVELRGLMHTHTPLGVTLAVGVVALAGLPPLGPFTSLFLIGTETVLRVPWLALPVGAGILACGWALLARLHRLCLTAPAAAGPPGNDRAACVKEMLPAWLLLFVVIALGLAMPPQVAAWLQEAAR